MENLSSKSLMIGDWVRVPKLAYHDEITDDRGYSRIKQLRTADLDVDSFKELAYTDIEPIPLTAEILEKNGFKVGHYLVGLTEKPEYKMVNRNELKNIEKNVITIRQSSDVLFDMQVGIGSHIFDIIYVHELQHALRLCGIDKEIKL